MVINETFIANSMLRTSLAIYQVISNACSWVIANYPGSFWCYSTLLCDLSRNPVPPLYKPESKLKPMATFFKQLPVSTLSFYWLMMMFTFIFIINNSVLVFHPLWKLLSNWFSLKRSSCLKCQLLKLFLLWPIYSINSVDKNQYIC